MFLYKPPHPLHVTIRGSWPFHSLNLKNFINTYTEIFISGAFLQRRHSGPRITRTERHKAIHISLGCIPERVRRITVVWYLAPCSMVERYRRSVGTFSLQFHGYYSTLKMGTTVLPKRLHL
jgi:hypothetical protein